MRLVLEVELKGSHKPINWRKVEVDGQYYFGDLHYIIQVIFGFTVAHLYQFSTKGWLSYPVIRNYNIEWDEEILQDPSGFSYGEHFQSTEIQLQDDFHKKGDKITYIYDFGDDWQFLITLKDVAADQKPLVRKCVSGKGNGVFEDCGGIYAYYQMMDVLKKPKNLDHEEYKSWLEISDDEPVYAPDCYKKQEINEYKAQFWTAYTSKCNRPQ